MTRHLHIDAAGGLAGDMLLAALVDAGLDREDFRQAFSTALAPLSISVSFEEVLRKGIRGLKARISTRETDSPHRGLSDVEELLGKAAVSETVRARSVDCFRRLAEVEARMHGTSIGKVHFHEVGAIDAIGDIVGVALAFELLGAGRITAGPVGLGTGAIACAHGPLPAPAPATIELLRGFSVRLTETPVERVTPTGAALLATWASPLAGTADLQLDSVGVGAGTRDLESHPNVTRVFLGRAGAGAPLWVVETNLDDERGETLGFALERLLEEGALDAWIQPVIMKKSRPGHVLSVLVSEERRAQVEAWILDQTSTLGVRRYRVERTILDRRSETVETSLGPVRVKIARVGNRVKAAPEYEDCRRIAEANDLSLREVEGRVQAALRRAGTPNETETRTKEQDGSDG